MLKELKPNSSCSRCVPDLNKENKKKPFIVSIEGNIGNILYELKIHQFHDEFRCNTLLFVST